MFLRFLKKSISAEDVCVIATLTKYATIALYQSRRERKVQSSSIKILVGQSYKCSS